MKNSVKQYTRQVIEDNKEFIEGNIAEYLLEEAQNSENGYQWYLSGDESVEYDEANLDKVFEIQNEIKEFINSNFNYDISDFDYLMNI